MRYFRVHVADAGGRSEGERESHKLKTCQKNRIRWHMPKGILQWHVNDR